MKLNAIEHEAMAMLLDGEHATLSVLRQQFERSQVSKREFTGSGFFTNFQVDLSAPRLAYTGRIVIGDVYAEMNGLQYGVGFILFVDDGRLNFLECFCHADDWSEGITVRRAYYVRRETGDSHGRLLETEVRDMKALSSMLRPSAT